MPDRGTPSSGNSGTRRFLAATALLGTVVCLLAVGLPWYKRKAESAGCGNYMAAICCTARAWAVDHSGRLPTDFRAISNDLVTPKVLVCPGDHSRHAAPDWERFTSNETSYLILVPGLLQSDADTPFLRCKIHGHLGYGDGTVFDGVGRRTKIPQVPPASVD